MASEATPLLDNRVHDHWDERNHDDKSLHYQFCTLIGIPLSNDEPSQDPPYISPKSLYGRAVRLKSKQQATYAFTAALSNALLLSQIVLGAALTALGASDSSHVLITLFGATNTIIAGIIAYMKSRGQPMRARMYRDDLERVVDEIDNSETMWKGISGHMHGYSEMDDSQDVTIRSEIARLTRLYERAVQTNRMNNPSMYQGEQAVKTISGNTQFQDQTIPALPPPNLDIARLHSPLPEADPYESPAIALPYPQTPQLGPRINKARAASPESEDFPVAQRARPRLRQIIAEEGRSRSYSRPRRELLTTKKVKRQMRDHSC